MVYRKKTTSANYKKKINPFRKRNTKGMIAKQKRGQLVKLIKDTQIAESEMKYKSGTLSVQSLYHNNVYEWHLWAPPGSAVGLYTLPGQGNTDGSRVGDRIYVKGFQVRAMFQISGDRRNTSIAAYYVPHNSEQGSPGSYGDLFHNVTGSSMMDTLQKKKFPGIKFLGRFRVKPADLWQHGALNLPQSCASIYMSTFIPIDKKVYFKADASTIPTNLKEYGTIVFAPYQNVNTLATDILVVNSDVHATCYFKDI